MAKHGDAGVVDAARFWDSQAIAPTHHNWLGHPLVRQYVNHWFGGPAGRWPLDWFQSLYPDPFPVGLSIGCGTGGLDRDVLRRGICREIDAFDASEQSLEIARTEAARESLSDRVRYRVDDFERVRLPRRKYDVIFFNQSLHHVSRIERLLRQVLAALRPGGIVYLDEYVGPSRTFWNEQTAAWYGALYRLVPEEARLFDQFRLPVQWDDLTEAVRSGEIVSRLRIGFEQEHVQGYGGNVLAVLWTALQPGRVPDSLVSDLIEAEQWLIEKGSPHYYAVMTFRPKKSPVARALATLRYLADPKMLRIGRELRALRGGRPYTVEEERFRM